MIPASQSTFDEETSDNTAEKLEVTNNQILLACILLVPKDVAPILALLKQVNGNSGRPITPESTRHPPDRIRDAPIRFLAGALGSSELPRRIERARSIASRAREESKPETWGATRIPSLHPR